MMLRDSHTFSDSTVANRTARLSGKWPIGLTICLCFLFVFVKDGNYVLGETSIKREDVKMTIDFKNKKYKADVQKATVTINITTVSEAYDKEMKTGQNLFGENSKLNGNASFTDVLGVVLGHEVEHTTDENVSLEYNRGNSEDAAYKVSDEIIDQLNEGNKE